MTFNVPEDIRFPTPTSKKHLEHIGRVCCIGLEKNLPNIIHRCVSYIDSTIIATKNFNEKQLLNDIKKKITQDNKIGLNFKKNIEAELANQIVFDNRYTARPLWWSNLSDQEKNTIDFKTFCERAEKNIDKKVLNSCEEIRKRVNCLTGENHEIFSFKVYLRAIVATLKNNFSNTTSLYLASLIMFANMQTELEKIQNDINKYLLDNNVLKRIDDYEGLFSEIKKIPKSWGWEKDGEQVVDRKTGYGSVTVPTDITLPSLDDFLTGRSTLVEEQKVAVPRFEPDKKKEEPKVVKEKIPEISTIIKDIDSVTDVSKIDFTLTIEEYKQKYSKIFDLQFKNFKGVNFSQKSVNTEQEFEHDSELSTNEHFMEQTENIHKKIRRLDLLNNEEILKNNLISDILEEIESNSMSNYDHYIFKILEQLYLSIISNTNLNIINKCIFYKLQIPLLHLLLLNKKNISSKDSTVRLLMEIIFSNELILNIQSVNLVEEVITESRYRYLKAEEYIKKLYDRIISIIEEQNNKEDKEISDSKDNVEKNSQIESCYKAVIKNIRKNIERVHYKPAREFIERVWTRAFVKKYSDSIKDNSLTEELFLRNMTITAKLNWQQSMVAIESISLISNNEENTPDRIIKMKDLISKVNSILPKVSVELDIDTNYVKALIALLKYKIDSFTKTSNKTMLNELLEKIKPNEDMFVKAVLEYEKTFGGHDIEESITDIIDVKIKLERNAWYELSNEHYKLKYYTPNNDVFLFIKSGEYFETYETNKAQINRLIKTGECKLLNSSELSGGFIKMLKYCNGNIN